MEILWDWTIHTYKTVAHNRPDIIVRDKKSKMAYLIDIAAPNQQNTLKTVNHKIGKYKELAIEVEKQWQVKTWILPIVVTTQGIISKTTVENVEKLGGERRDIRVMQKAVILHTTHIVRKMLGENL